MRKELEEVKSIGEQDIIAHRKATQENETIMQELNAMKAMLEKKERAIVRLQLQNALQSIASCQVNAEVVVKILKAGKLQKFNRNRKVKSSREKWVQLKLHDHQITKNGFERGYMLLTYSDSKDAKLSTRCQVISLSYGDKDFLVGALVGGVEKELFFLCADENERNDWMEAFNDGFLQIEGPDLNKLFYLNVEFSKEKLGFCIAEVFLESDDQDLEEKPNEASVVEAAKRENTVEPKQNAETKTEDEGTLSSLNNGQPCELHVKKITDSDLYETGLVEGCVITAINQITIRGMSYEKQVDMITKTKKPYTLTFTGPLYLKKKANQTTAHPRILKELVAHGDNYVKSAFVDLIKGTTFRKEFEESDDKIKEIEELLSNQRRLTALLQNVRMQ